MDNQTLLDIAMFIPTATAIALLFALADTSWMTRLLRARLGRTVRAWQRRAGR